MRRLRLNPITRKRLRRFREMKRAHWSFWSIVVLYVLSLGSELLCNSVPLYVRYQGRSHFPVFRFYPDDLFTGSGKFTRPDYKAIRDSAAFQTDPANRMVFSPFPYGPYEVVDPKRIEIPDTVSLRLTHEPRVCSVVVTPELVVARALSAESFFGRDSMELRGAALTDYWRLPDRLLTALRSRFANQPSPRVAVVCSNRSGADAELSCPAFEPRSQPPRTVRLTFREVHDDQAKVGVTVFDRSLAVVGRPGTGWQQVPDDVKAGLLRDVAERFETRVEPRFITIRQTQYQVRLDREEIRFPFRPVRGHWLGIDSAGRDVLARVLYGLRTSMTFGLVLVVCSLCAGTAIGAVQGYFGGVLDITCQRLIEVWSALPFLYIMILMGSIYGRGLGLLIVCYGLFNWIGMSYYMRAEFLRLRKQPFVEAARCLGLPAWKVVFRHVLPNALVPLITFFPFSLVGAIGSLAALDYLGFGLPPPTPSWGELLQQAQQFRWAWWLILFPSVSLFAVMLMGVFVGEGVRNAFDPRRYSRLV